MTKCSCEIKLFSCRSGGLTKTKETHGMAVDLQSSWKPQSLKTAFIPRELLSLCLVGWDCMSRLHTGLYTVTLLKQRVLCFHRILTKFTVLMCFRNTLLLHEEKRFFFSCFPPLLFPFSIWNHLLLVKDDVYFEVKVCLTGLHLGCFGGLKPNGRPFRHIHIWELSDSEGFWQNVFFCTNGILAILTTFFYCL